ncbi:MAG: isocitrate/isopropylmalate dehydrogenase family protein [Anaerolineae bacterium]|nr:isocitrate/isopropylmalate dehydrogenase family protein [Anaerolineae bacterium]
MTYDITLIPGDGIGPEVTSAAQRVLAAAGVTINWDIQHAGAGVIETHHTPLPPSVLDSIRANKVALKGPITTPVGSGFRSVNVAIRKELDLFANIRPARTLPGIPLAHENVDVVVIRENTEGLYVGIEHEVIAGEAAEAVRIITRKGSERIVRFAFDYARNNGRQKVTAVHKANILKITDGLFLKAARLVAAAYEDIDYEEAIVDAACMQLALRPADFDVLVLPNLYGDIVSDLCSGLVGGLGVTPAANIGLDYAVFEPVHGSAPTIAGLNKANPSAAILTAALMLRHLGEVTKAENIENAVYQIIADGRYVTADLKPSLTDPTAVGTREMTDAIIARL